MRPAEHRIRLNSATIASAIQDGRSIALLIPTGAEVIPLDAVPEEGSGDDGREVSVEWQGRTVSMFLVDLRERGEQV
jgi:hypothetical protein